MSERLKRRKKSGDETGKDAANAPEPLQPKYYDSEPAPAAEASSEPLAIEAHPHRGNTPEADHDSAHSDSDNDDRHDESAPDSELAPKAAAGVTQRPRIPRRRRGRGGRGGLRSRPAAASPATLAAAASATGEPSVSAPATAAGVPARASKGTVILAIGLPGSGKSSWFKRHNIHPLSSDLLRELLFDDAQEQRFQDLVFSNLRSMLKARLIARRPLNYVDATNLTPHDRNSWIKLAKDYGYDVQGLFFDVPLEVCMERHQRRGRVVPEDIMRKMAAKLKAPTFEEGFSKITVVRVKQKEAAAGE